MLTKNGEILSVFEVQRIIEQLRNIDRIDGFNSYTYIYNLLNSLIIPCPPVTLKKGEKFIRGRVHRNNELFFENISDVSYRSDLKNILSFGRANEPHQSIFYCSDNQATALNETLSVAREEIDIEYEEITWSVWELTKDIELLYIIGNPEKPTPNQTVNEATKVFLEKMERFEFADIKEQVILFHKFISDAFVLKAKVHDALYKISCAFANYIYSHSFCDSFFSEIRYSAGIMYSSARCPELGMNMALKPEIVDDSLKIIEVQKARMVRTGTSGYYIEKETFIAKEIDIENNKIYW